MTNHGLTVERLRLLIQHYSDELPDHHTLYSESYKIAERQTVAALMELIALRGEVNARITHQMRDIERLSAEVIRLTDALREIAGCKVLTDCGVHALRAAGQRQAFDIVAEIANKALAGLPAEPTCKCLEVDAGGSVGFDVKDCQLHNPESPQYVGRNSLREPKALLCACGAEATLCAVCAGMEVRR